MMKDGSWVLPVGWTEIINFFDKFESVGVVSLAKVEHYWVFFYVDNE